MIVKKSFRRFLVYFSAKSRMERKEKIIAYRTKKYTNFTKDELQLVIIELENKETTAKSLFTFLNIAVFSAVAWITVYVFKQFILWVMATNHVWHQSGIPQEAIQYGKLVDIGLGGILIVMLLFFLGWYTDRRRERIIVLHVLKKRLREG